MKNKIAIMSGKGGVGKTTLTSNLGTILAMQGSDVGIIDANIGVPNLGLHMGMPLVSQGCTRDILLEVSSLKKSWVVNEDGLKIIVANIIKKPSHHSVTLSNLSRVLSTDQTNYVLIDSPPGANQDTINIFNACDELVIVTTPELPAVTASVDLIEQARIHNKKIMGLVINRVTGKPWELEPSEIARRCNVNILGIIPENSLIPESIAMRLPLVKYAPKSNASNAMRDIAALMQNKPLPKSNARSFTILNSIVAFFKKLFENHF